MLELEVILSSKKFKPTMAAKDILDKAKEFLKNSPGVISATVLMLIFNEMNTESLTFTFSEFYGLFGVLIAFGTISDVVKDLRLIYSMEDSKKKVYRKGLGIPFMKFEVTDKVHPYVFVYMVYRMISNIMFLLAMTVVIEAHGDYFASCGNATADNPERALCGSESGIILSSLILVMVRAVFKYPWKEVEDKEENDTATSPTGNRVAALESHV